jgi:hypothetical protein
VNSTVNEMLESFGGKDATRQQAGLRGQDVANALVRKELGLKPDTPLTDTLMEQLNTKAGQTYRDIAGLSPNAKTALNAYMDARQRYNQFSTEHARTGTVAAYDMAQKYKTDMGYLEKALESEAAKAGRTDLLQQLPSARQEIAKIKDVSRALNESTGNVSPVYFGNRLKNNKPVSGELEVIGAMQRAFPRVFKEGEKIPAPGVSHVNSMASTALGLGGYATAGPGGALLAALPLGRGPVRNLILSEPYQNLMLNPRYGGAVANTAAKIPPLSIDPVVAALLGRTATLPEGGPQ